MRIAMWSGPRNLSTAMMYAFGARDDCAVVDEPFYAAYLARTGLDHPMRDEILATQPQDPARVVDALIGSIPAGRPHFYQKHMTQHMIPGIPRDWMARVTNVFLIRHPARVVASFGAKYDNPTLADIQNVVSARIFLLARTTEIDTRYTNEKTYSISNAPDYAPGDSFHRRVFSTTVSIQNIRSLNMMGF